MVTVKSLTYKESVICISFPFPSMKCNSSGIILNVPEPEESPVTTKSPNLLVPFTMASPCIALVERCILSSTIWKSEIALVPK